MVEATLMLPWIMFLFIAVFDIGFYYYGAIATENAARAAVLANTSMLNNENNQSLACRYAMEEMRAVPNIAVLDFTTFNCTAAPLQVDSIGVTGPDGRPAARVTVTYQSDLFLPLPFLPGRLNLTRYAEGRVYGD
jgi:hypothetical protein